MKQRSEETQVTRTQILLEHLHVGVIVRIHGLRQKVKHLLQKRYDQFVEHREHGDLVLMDQGREEWQQVVELFDRAVRDKALGKREEERQYVGSQYSNKALECETNLIKVSEIRFHRPNTYRLPDRFDVAEMLQCRSHDHFQRFEEVRYDGWIGDLVFGEAFANTPDSMDRLLYDNNIRQFLLLVKLP